MSEEIFSKRHGFSNSIETEIRIRNDAPYDLRSALIQIAYETGFKPKTLREVVCRILRKRPDKDNWSDFPNIDEEIHDLIDECPWYRVYDVAEGIIKKMDELPLSYEPDRFRTEFNGFFIENGIGWQLKKQTIEIRGPESFENIIQTAQKNLVGSQKATAGNELHEALVDLSRRPEPDITGAIQHSMASLECIARDVCGDPKATLGEILKRHKDLIPSPIDETVKTAWGFASERARHIREGREPEFPEAELIVGICASVGNYLLRKLVA